MSKLLRTDVASQMSGSISVAIRMTVEADHAPAGFLGASIVSLIELLLRKSSHQQSQTLKLFGIQNAVKQLKEVLDSHQLPLRNVSKIRTRREKHWRRELREEVIGKIEV